AAATAESEYEITGNGYASEGEIKQDGKPADTNDPTLALMGHVAALCNDAELFEAEGVWRVDGDPTEGPLYPLPAKTGTERDRARKAYARIDVIPFESEHKFMATLHKSGDGSEYLLVKGAPEVILEHCDRQETRDGKGAPLDRERFSEAADRF